MKNDGTGNVRQGLLLLLAATLAAAGIILASRIHGRRVARRSRAPPVRRAGARHTAGNGAAAGRELARGAGILMPVRSDR